MNDANTLSPKQQTGYMALIGVLSVAVPVVVAILLFSGFRLESVGFDTRVLVHVNAALNSLTAICLVAAFVAVKNKRIKAHRGLMMAAFSLSALFLVSYVVYHATVPSTKFGDSDGNGLVDAAELASVGAMRYVYLAVLLSHILLSAIIIPFVLTAMYYAVIAKDYVKHKKVTRFAWPMWTYVAFSGVAVYLMISPYYGG